MKIINKIITFIVVLFVQIFAMFTAGIGLIFRLLLIILDHMITCQKKLKESLAEECSGLYDKK